jgi:hypothetical protein
MSFIVEMCGPSVHFSLSAVGTFPQNASYGSKLRQHPVEEQRRQRFASITNSRTPPNVRFVTFLAPKYPPPGDVRITCGESSRVKLLSTPISASMNASLTSILLDRTTVWIDKLYWPHELAATMCDDILVETDSTLELSTVS